jgi:hypothetical protein
MYHGSRRHESGSVYSSQTHWFVSLRMKYSTKTLERQNLFIYWLKSGKNTACFPFVISVSCSVSNERSPPKDYVKKYCISDFLNSALIMKCYSVYFDWCSWETVPESRNGHLTEAFKKFQKYKWFKSSVQCDQYMKLYLASHNLYMFWSKYTIFRRTHGKLLLHYIHIAIINTILYV